MDGKTTPGRTAAASGHSRLAGRPAVVSSGRPFASVADIARVAPFVAGWPYRTSLELGALPSAVPCARLHTRQVLWEWRLTGLAHSAELLVSELVTNAITASRSAGSDCPVRLCVDDHVIEQGCWSRY